MLAIATACLFVSPAQAATLKSVVPPFHATVAPFAQVSRVGCGTTRVSHGWSFGVRSGALRGGANADLVSCPSALHGPLPSESASNLSAGATVDVPFRLPGHVRMVSAQTRWNFSASASISDGSATPLPACSARPATADDTTTTYEWNWTVRSGNNNSSSGYFADFNTTTTDESNGVWTNSSYGNAARPSPFNENATSYLARSRDFGSSAVCTAEADLVIAASVVLRDLSTGQSIPATGSTLAPTGLTVDLTISNRTAWTCSNTSSWDGPAGSSSRGSLGCSSSNSTFRSVEYLDPPLSISTSALSQRSWSLNENASEFAWWNRSAPARPFATHDHFELVVTVDIAAVAANDWRHGFGRWSFDMATGGRGLFLESIVAS